MSTAELKEEIYKIVDLVPEKALEEILTFAKSKQNPSKEKGYDEIFEQILIEDREVLQKLAK
ncbi:hypothetical protein [Mucilaginibacter phyllosphaerae]